mgnify:CR=1 FL=1|jgi:hypothetical protein
MKTAEDRRRENLLAFAWVCGVVVLALGAMLVWSQRDQIKSSFESWAQRGNQHRIEERQRRAEELEAKTKLAEVNEMKQKIEKFHEGSAKWVKNNLADPEASVKSVGPAFAWNGKEYRVVSIRGHNGFGGWIFSYWMFTFDADGRVISTEGDFRDFLQKLADSFGKDYKSAIHAVYDLCGEAGLDPDYCKGISFDRKRQSN